MAKNNAKAPKPVVAGGRGVSNSTDKMASKSSATFATGPVKGSPAQYAADSSMKGKAF